MRRVIKAIRVKREPLGQKGTKEIPDPRATEGDAGAKGDKGDPGDTKWEDDPNGIAHNADGSEDGNVGIGNPAVGVTRLTVAKLAPGGAFSPRALAAARPFGTARQGDHFALFAQAQAHAGGLSFGVVGVASGGDGSVGVSGFGETDDFFAYGPGTDYASASSIRWKRNIMPIENALNRISRLRGVYFDWDADHGGEHDLGMIAEEVGQFFPEIVSFEPDGEYAIGLDYSKLTPILVQAVKEQQAIIEQQQAELAEMQATLAALESALRNLELQSKEK